MYQADRDRRNTDVQPPPRWKQGSFAHGQRPANKMRGHAEATTSKASTPRPPPAVRTRFALTQGNRKALDNPRRPSTALWDSNVKRRNVDRPAAPRPRTGPGGRDCSPHHNRPSRTSPHRSKPRGRSRSGGRTAGQRHCGPRNPVLNRQLKHGDDQEPTRQRQRSRSGSGTDNLRYNKARNAELKRLPMHGGDRERSPNRSVTHHQHLSPGPAHKSRRCTEKATSSQHSDRRPGMHEGAQRRTSSPSGRQSERTTRDRGSPRTSAGRQQSSARNRSSGRTLSRQPECAGQPVQQAARPRLTARLTRRSEPRNMGRHNRSSGHRQHF